MSATDDLFRAALAARDKAYAPYSGFAVGAAVMSATGVVYAGCNAENASFPEGWCAETAAIARMIAAGERAIAEICVVSGSAPPAPPCGGCRQRLAEFAPPEARIHLADTGGIRQTFSLGELLPAGFTLERGG